MINRKKRTFFSKNLITNITKYSIIKNYTNLYNNIFNQIKYKNTAGIRLRVKGRLTKRYRADRTVYKLFNKGGLKSLDSTYLGLSGTTFRGYKDSNITFSLSKSKRRIGAYAIKGWMSGN